MTTPTEPGGRTWPGASPGWRTLPMGDRAVLIDCQDNALAAAVAGALTRSAAPGQRELVPGARSVLVVSDGNLDSADVAMHLGSLSLAAEEQGMERHVTIDVVYDGPDLAEIAELTGLGVDGVVAAHTSTPWRAVFTGFAPGFGYLTGGDPRLRVPRRATPRAEVPAGSVGLAGEFSGVYPRSSPGGWQLIGRTDAPLWDPGRDPPALIRPGTVVTFRAVEALRVVAGASRMAGGSPGAVSARWPSGAAPDSHPGGPGDRSITVVRPGISCLVEDLGRPGMAAEGVSRSGAADRRAALRANRIVGNRVGAAVLEVVPGRVEVRSGGALLVAVTGAPAPVAVDGAPARVDAPIALADGQSLTIGPPAAGLRCYLAVRGGIEVAPVLHSRSTDLLAGIGPAPIRAGDVLPVGDDRWGTPRAIGAVPQPGAADDMAGDGTADPVVTVIPGPQSDQFAGSPAALAGVTWRVLPASNRVGIRLDGPPLRRTSEGEIPSQGLVPGAIQVPPDGRPVIMLADHPVTGGYPVIGVVRSADLDRLAQLRPGAVLRIGVAGGN